MTKQENLRKAPSEARKEGGCNHQGETHGVERGFTGDHHDNTHSHGGDNDDQLEGWSFETKDKGE